MPLYKKQVADGSVKDSYRSYNLSFTKGTEMTLTADFDIKTVLITRIGGYYETCNIINLFWMEVGGLIACEGNVDDCGAYITVNKTDDNTVTIKSTYAYFNGSYIITLLDDFKELQ